MTLPDLTVEGVFDAAVCTFDGFNYLTPDELRLTMAAVARRLRPAGWLVFDLHTDAMMDFTISNPVVAGESAGNDFVISSVVDPGARTCDTRIELTRPREGDPFCEQHRQYFHTDADVRASLEDAGFTVTAVGEEYTHQPVDASTLRATWTARRLRRDLRGPIRRSAFVAGFQLAGGGAQSAPMSASRRWSVEGRGRRCTRGAAQRADMHSAALMESGLSSVS